MLGLLRHLNIVNFNLMKKYFLNFLTLLCLFFFSFTRDKKTYQTECVSIETDGYAVFKIWDTQKGANYKPEQAREDAITAILFSGIAGTNGCSTQPPILNNLEVQEKFKKIEKEFFARKGKWSTFTLSSAIDTTIPLNIGEKNWKVYQVSVSKKDLRKYLEELNIINSLKKGF